jgi:post-segregation antitoxin (ccd killing protein)
MAKTDVTLSLDETLLARARATGGDLSAIVETALSQHLDRGADRRWAEDNAILVEALAGGAEEAKAG